MQTTIENTSLKAVISHKGAELVSLWKNSENFIWDVETEFWDKTSPVLFPIVGCLKENKYSFQAKEYHLSRHGFAREQEFNLIEKNSILLYFL